MFMQQRIYILLMFFTFAMYTQQQVKDAAFIEKWNKVHQECGAQEGIDLGVAKKAWDENHFPNDNKLKCFYKCVNLKMGVMDQTGEVVDSVLGTVAAEFNNAATTTEIVAECGPLKGADLCETAYKLIACVKAATLD